MTDQLKIETPTEYEVSMTGLHRMEDAVVAAYRDYTEALTGNDLLLAKASLDGANSVIEDLCTQLGIDCVRIRYHINKKDVFVHVGDMPSSYAKLEKVKGNAEAPVGYHWVCSQCGKRAEWKYGFDDKGDRRCDGGWDESCLLNGMFSKDGEGA